MTPLKVLTAVERSGAVAGGGYSTPETQIVLRIEHVSTVTVSRNRPRVRCRRFRQRGSRERRIDGDGKVSRGVGRVAAIAALVVAVVAAVLLLRGGETYRVTAEFQNAAQIVKGNEVVVGGTNVGLVEEIDLGADGQALITFNVSESPVARFSSSCRRPGARERRSSPDRPSARAQPRPPST
jgi:hypothetical protein